MNRFFLPVRQKSLSEKFPVSNEGDFRTGLGYNDMFFLSNDLETSLFQSADRILVIDSGECRQDQTVASTSRTSSSRTRSSVAAKYS